MADALMYRVKKSEKNSVIYEVTEAPHSERPDSQSKCCNRHAGRTGGSVEAFCANLIASRTFGFIHAFVGQVQQLIDVDVSPVKRGRTD